MGVRRGQIYRDGINDLLMNVQFSYHCLLAKALTHEKLGPQLLLPVGTLEMKAN